MYVKVRVQLWMLLWNKERIPAFEKLWKDSFEEFYLDVDRKEKLEKIRKKRLKLRSENSE